MTDSSQMLTKSESGILTMKEALEDITKAREITLEEMETTEQLIQRSTVSNDENYESLKKELKDDLLIFNKKLYSTIPLSPLFEKNDTPFGDFYIQPSMDCLEYYFFCKSRRGDIRTEINFIGDIFRAKRTNEIYVISKAGLGKTVFCKRLVVAWCHAHDKKTAGANFETEDVVKLMEGFDYTFLVPLRETHRSDCNVDIMIQNQIITNLARSDRYTFDFLQDILTKERCLIILDGLDEWTHPKDKPDCRTVNDIPHRKARENCTIVTTSRTWKFCLLTLSTNQIDNLVQINGLSDKAAEELSNNAFSKISLEDMKENTRDIQGFHITMQKDIVSKFKRVPLILIHLLCLWRTDHTIGDSYCEIFSNIIGLHLKRAQIRAKTTERSALKTLKMRKFDMPKCIAKNKHCHTFYELLLSLGILAFETYFGPTRENSLVFDISTAKRYLLDKFEFCLSAGLLTKSKTVKEDHLESSPRVSFAHKTFQEYFAALHLFSSAVKNTKIKSVVDTCSSVNDIISVSNFYIFLNGMCPEKAKRLSHEFCRVVAFSDIVKGYRSDMGSWNYFVGYNETIKRIQNMFVECVKESIDNGYTPVRFHVEDIIIDADFQTDTYSKAMKFILEENEKNVKSLKIRDVKTKDEFRSLVNILSTKRSVALEKLDLKCEICDESLELVLQKSVHSLKCFIIKGGKWLGNCWSHNHVSLSNKSLLTIWSMTQLEEIYLRNIEMTHDQLKNLLGFVSSSVNMKHIGLGFLKCKKHDESCSEYMLDLSNHSQLRMLEIGSVPLSSISINTQSLEVCYVGNFAKSDVLLEISSYLSSALKLRVFVCGFLTVQSDIERMLKTIPTLTNLQHIWLINMDLGCTTFELSQNMTHIENIFMLRLEMKVETLRKLIEGVKLIPKTVRVGLYDCSVESSEEYEDEIRNLKSSQTIQVIQDVTKNQKDFIFKTIQDKTQSKVHVKGIQDGGIGKQFFLCSQNELNKMWTFPDQKEKVFEECEKICSFIETRYKHIEHIWPSYDERATDKIVFVVFVDKESESKNVRDALQELGYNVFVKGIKEYSSEASVVLNSTENQNCMLTFTDIEEIRIAINIHTEELLKNHHYLSVISGSGVKSINFQSDKQRIFQQRCIVFYVHTKGKIPLREQPLPSILEGIPIDVREGIFETTTLAPDKYHRNLRMGCQITSNANPRSHGTLGGFVDHPELGLCGITCAHVLLNNKELHEIRGEKKVWQTNENYVYQPNTDKEKHRVGPVVEAVYRSGSENSSGIDMGVFKIEGRVPESGEFSTDQDITYDSGRTLDSSGFDKYRVFVTKFGATTGKSEGILEFNDTAVKKIEYHRKYRYSGTPHIYTLTEQLEIRPRHDSCGQTFSDDGDSGALVFMKDETNKLVCIGMIVGKLVNTGNAIVIPISVIKKELGVSHLFDFRWQKMDILERKMDSLEKKVDNMDKNLNEKLDKLIKKVFEKEKCT